MAPGRASCRRRLARAPGGAQWSAQCHRDEPPTSWPRGHGFHRAVRRAPRCVGLRGPQPGGHQHSRRPLPLQPKRPRRRRLR
eukprot:3517143-Alexandrium_andersonii.AAC.1